MCDRISIHSLRFACAAADTSIVACDECILIGGGAGPPRRPLLRRRRPSKLGLYWAKNSEGPTVSRRRIRTPRWRRRRAPVARRSALHTWEVTRFDRPLPRTPGSRRAGSRAKRRASGGEPESGSESRSQFPRHSDAFAIRLGWCSEPRRGDTRDSTSLADVELQSKRPGERAIRCNAWHIRGAHRSSAKDAEA